MHPTLHLLGRSKHVCRSTFGIADRIYNGQQLRVALPADLEAAQGLVEALSCWPMSLLN